MKYFFFLLNLVSHVDASHCDTGFLVLSKTAGDQNVSCMGLFGWYICPKSKLNMDWLPSNDKLDYIFLIHNELYCKEI